MKLASFHAAGRDRFGIVTASGLVDLSRRLPARTLRQLLAQGVQAAHPFETSAADFGLGEVEWLPPVTDPLHIVAVGLNTKSHFDETAERMGRTPGDFPKKPRLFLRSPDSHAAHGQPIWLPRVSGRLDYEGEIAMIIGKAGRHIPAGHALAHVAGYACYNDGSVRDYQKHSAQVTAGKNFTRSGGFGPWLTTTDEAPPTGSLNMQVRINGEPRQNLVPEDLIFGFADLISYISEIFTLQPGDVLVTGSPSGVGAISGNFLKVGDVVEVEVGGVGVLRNTVEAEPVT